MFDTNTKQRKQFIRSIGRPADKHETLIAVSCGIVLAVLVNLFFI